MLVRYQDEAERLLFAGPPRSLPTYRRAGRLDLWTRHRLDANSAVRLTQLCPSFAQRLTAACQRYAALLPPAEERVAHLSDADDVVLRDAHEPLRRCLAHWGAFAAFCSAALELLQARPGCETLAADCATSLRAACPASIDEYEAWLEQLEAAVSRVIAARTRKRPAAPEPDDGRPKQQRCHLNLSDEPEVQ